MNEEKKVSEGKLLYDPLFEKKPDIEIRDDPSKGFFGKAGVRKTIFIVVLSFFIILSLFLSFYSVSKDKYRFEENEQGWLFAEFNGSSEDKFLSIDYAVGENNLRDSSKPVTEVRKFAICCNEYLEYIFVSDTVDVIDPTSFYYCKALKAVIVDPGNKNYVSYDGVLYKKENGIATEIMLYPMNNGYYRAALALGYEAPADENGIDEYIGLVEQNATRIAEKYKTVGVNYEIRDSVTKIGQLCFSTCEEMESIKIPQGVTEIETLAFFKCKALKGFELPDGLKKIGSDAFSSCTSVEYIFVPASVTEIDHHAFSNCSAAASVHMGHKDDSGLILGSQWLPQTRKVFLTDVEVLYNQTREGN